MIINKFRLFVDYIVLSPLTLAPAGQFLRWQKQDLTWGNLKGRVGVHLKLEGKLEENKGGRWSEPVLLDHK